MPLQDDALDIIKTIRETYDSTKVTAVAQELTNTAQEKFVFNNTATGNLSDLPMSDDALLASFYKLSEKDQVTILQDAVLAHQKFNWYKGQKVNTVRDLELFDLKTWGIKVITSGVVLFVIAAALITLFVPNTPAVGLFPNGEFLNDIFNLIFS